MKQKFKQTEVGLIPEDWEVVSQKELVRFINGRAYSYDEFRENGTPIVRIQNLTGNKEFVYSDLKLGDDKYIDKGDLIYAWSATFGPYIWNGPKAIYHYHIWKIECDEEKVDKNFFYYKLKYVSNRISDTGTGSIFTHITKQLMEESRVSIPSLTEQKAIANVLSCFDSKIGLNSNMNKTLEALSKLLFKHWFIDFEFPNSEGKPYKSSGGEMIYNEDIGKNIPKGWSVVPLSEITTTITKGTTPTKKDIEEANKDESKINFIRVNAMTQDGDFIYDKLITIPESVHTGVLKRSILQANDVLYTIAGTIGRISVVEQSLLPANTNQAVAIIRPVQTIPSNFLALAMRQIEFKEELHSNIVHAVQANLSLGSLSKSRLVLPPNDILMDMFKPIDNIMKRIIANRTESRTLTLLRDMLLPKLMSGKIRVPLEV